MLHLNQKCDLSLQKNLLVIINVQTVLIDSSWKQHLPTCPFISTGAPKQPWLFWWLNTDCFNTLSSKHTPTHTRLTHSCIWTRPRWTCFLHCQRCDVDHVLECNVSMSTHAALHWQQKDYLPYNMYNNMYNIRYYVIFSISNNILFSIYILIYICLFIFLCIIDIFPIIWLFTEHPY